MNTLALSQTYFDSYKGKAHDPIFFAYLAGLDEHKREGGGIKQPLADELLAIGQAKGLTDKDELKAGVVRNIAESFNSEKAQVFAAWLQQAAIILAHEKQIPINERVAAATAKSLVRDFQPDKGAPVSIKTFMLHMEITLNRKFGDDLKNAIIQAVKAVRYQNIID